MKLFLSCLTGCLFMLLLLSCGNRASKEENETAAADEQSKDESVIYLEGMYATSIQLPLRQYALENIFDGNSQTYWSTAKGAGPDEGFVLYFSEKTYVKNIQLTAATGDGLASIEKVSVYADGHKISNFNLSGEIGIDKTLTSLFVKIGSTDHSNEINLAAEDEDREESIEKFDAGFSVGISDIKLFGNNGALQVKAPATVAGSVTASSVLKPSDAYAAAQLFDSRREFVWAEGAKGAGENEILTFTLNEDQTISSFKIWNGYQRSEKHFGSNARVKSFEFGLKNASKVRYTLEDRMEPQQITLNEPLSGKEFELKVLEVYPGKDYKDLVVSEILFFNKSIPFVIHDNTVEEKVKSFMATTKGSVLENYLDRRLKNHESSRDFSSDKSLILRSNRTFVLYDHTISNDGSTEEDKEVVADGNWEVIEQTGDYAKIRIFGKLFNLSETIEYYKGNTTTEFVKIFQDNLTITPEEVIGEKYIDSFNNKSSETL